MLQNFPQTVEDRPQWELHTYCWTNSPQNYTV